MGASGWKYYADFDPDLNSAFTRLQQTVLDSGDFLWEITVWDDDLDDDVTVALPATLTELELVKDAEAFWESGTHSILDMGALTDADSDEFDGSVRPLTEREVLSFLGSARPTAADFERSYADFSSPLIAELRRWSGRCTVLYDGDQPSQYAFWGVSGD